MKLANALDLHRRKCNVCGKIFEASNQYVFKTQRTRHRDSFDYYCSYSCLRAYEKEQEKKKNIKIRREA